MRTTNVPGNTARASYGRPRDHPYGERQCTAQDFVGRSWTFSQAIADVVPEERGATSGQL
jgi:hypothetical protein